MMSSCFSTFLSAIIDDPDVGWSVQGRNWNLLWSVLTRHLANMFLKYIAFESLSVSVFMQWWSTDCSKLLVWHTKTNVLQTSVLVYDNGVFGYTPRTSRDSRQTADSPWSGCQDSGAKFLESDISLDFVGLYPVEVANLSVLKFVQRLFKWAMTGLLLLLHPPRCFAPCRLDTYDILGRSRLHASETQQRSWPTPSWPRPHLSVTCF